MGITENPPHKHVRLSSLYQFHKTLPRSFVSDEVLKSAVLQHPSVLFNPSPALLPHDWDRHPVGKSQILEELSQESYLLACMVLDQVSSSTPPDRASGWNPGILFSCFLYTLRITRSNLMKARSSTFCRSSFQASANSLKLSEANSAYSCLRNSRSFCRATLTSNNPSSSALSIFKNHFWIACNVVEGLIFQVLQLVVGMLFIDFSQTFFGPFGN